MPGSRSMNKFFSRLRNSILRIFFRAPQRTPELSHFPFHALPKPACWQLYEFLDPVDIITLIVASEESSAFIWRVMGKPKKLTFEYNEHCSPFVKITATFWNVAPFIWHMLYLPYGEKRTDLEICGRRFSLGVGTDENGRQCLRSNYLHHFEQADFFERLQNLFRSKFTCIKLEGDVDKFFKNDEDLLEHAINAPELFLSYRSVSCPLEPNFLLLHKIVCGRADFERSTRIDELILSNSPYFPDFAQKFVLADTIHIKRNSLSIEQVATEAQRHWRVDVDPLKALTVEIGKWTPKMVKKLKALLQLVPFDSQANKHFQRPQELTGPARTYGKQLFWRGDGIPAEMNGTQWIFQFYKIQGKRSLRFEMARWKC